MAYLEIPGAITLWELLDVIRTASLWQNLILLLPLDRVVNSIGVGVELSLHKVDENPFEHIARKMC